MKLVVAIRTDLGLGRGKLAAQVAHAAVAAALACLETAPGRDWLAEGQPKVVVRVDGLDELEAVVGAAVRAGLPVQVVADAGRTQVEPGTRTCCAVGPAPDADVDAVTGALRLL